MNIVFIIFVLFFVGCAKIHYEDPAGAKISYSRFWNQSMTDVEFNKTAAGDLSVHVGKQKSDMTDLTAVLKDVSGTAKALSGVAAKVTGAPIP